MSINLLLNWVVMPILVLAVILAFIRLLRGPKLPSRVIALDMTAVLGIGIIVVYAVLKDQPVLIDVGAVLALVSFLGTIAFAAYVEKRT
jgi:multicomponent Na+:H+ antiporter subunit F